MTSLYLYLCTKHPMPRLLLINFVMASLAAVGSVAAATSQPSKPPTSSSKTGTSSSKSATSSSSSKTKPSNSTKTSSLQSKSSSAPKAPTVESNGAPRVHAASAILIDAKTGQVLHSVNADQERAVASTQKLMTALIVAESGGLDKLVKVEASDTWAEPSKLDIKPGETYRRGDLLRILLIKSMNDVARALARDNAGSVEAFSEKMNTRAEALGMTHSYFVNPNGLPAPKQHSTARDMAKVAAAAYRNNTIRSIVCLKDLDWQHPDGHVSSFHNTNRVLSSLKYCNGMKTGYTQAAGFCLVSSASTSGKDVISVVLGDAKEYVWNDSERLLVWGLRGEDLAADGQ